MEGMFFLREAATPLNIGAMFCRGVPIIFEVEIWRLGAAFWVEPLPVTEAEDETALPVGAVSLADSRSGGLARGVSSVARIADGGVTVVIVGTGPFCVFSLWTGGGELVWRVDEKANVCG
jgi:hypothetical protein